MALQHLRSSTAHKRPIPTVMSAGQIAINTNEASPALFFKDSNGDLVKVGPVHIGTDAPNSSPASVAATALVTGTVYQILTVGTSDFTLVGASANTVGTIFTATGTTTGTGTVSGQQGVEKGEMWLDTTGGTYVLKIYDGSAWRSESGTFVDVSGDTMTGALLLDNAASASAPDLSFDGDANTGIYSPGADQVAIATGGNGRVFIDSSGRVGVGTSSPGYRLDVKSPGNGQFFINGQNSLGNNIFQVYESSTGDGNNGLLYLFDNAGNNNVKLSTNGSSWFTGGNVGIGTTSPGNLLHLNNDATTGTDVSYFRCEANSSNFQIKCDDMSNTNSGWAFVTGASESVRFVQGAGEVLKIDSAGRLLVGASTAFESLDQAKLQINGTTNSYALIALQRNDTSVSADNALGQISFYSKDDGTSDECVRIRGSADTVAHSATSKGTKLQFYTTTEGTLTLEERMRIDSSGNVGIGTSSPQAITGYTVLTLNNSSQGGAIEFKNNNTSYGRLLQGSSAVILETKQDIPLVFGTGTSSTERMRIDSSGRLLVGTSSTSVGSTAIFEGYSVSSTGPSWVYFQRGQAAASIAPGDNLGIISFADNAGNVFGQINCQTDAAAGSGDYPGRLVFSTTADGASSPTERMRISSDGAVIIDDSGNLQTDGVYVRPNGGTIDTNRLISAASAGSTTATVYIGNAAIQVSSDARIKKEIEDTTLDALTAISQVKVKDFLWDDPTDASYNNRNARGKWTGLIAQELVEILPFVVNAPRKEEDGSVDYESEALWTLDQSQLCPVLIKAIQQQQEIIAGLEARLSALEAA